MTSWLASLPSPSEFFPPSPRVFAVISTVFRISPLFSIAQWTSLKNAQEMGRTSSNIKAWYNFPGRYAWAAAEAIGPLNLAFIMYNLPKHLKPVPASASSLFGTGLPIQAEIMGLLYIVHYINRAGITPLFLAPSMSPIHARVSVFMSLYQYVNSSNIACWLIYSLAGSTDSEIQLLTPASITGLILFVAGLAGNIIADNKLFSLRKAAARRKAKSEGKAVITYEKVYVIPPAEGLFKSIMFPHYSWEWLEWAGYWILGGAWGFGYGWNVSAALWFVISEISNMAPRAYDGKQWYEKKFGKRALEGRRAVIPGIL